MSYQENLWLEKYEIKKPDYDYIEREYVGMSDVQYEPYRYVKQGDLWVQKNKKNTKKAKLMFTGDITCFERQMEEARIGKDYDFKYAFESMKPIFEQADLVVGNLETMLSPSAPYRFEQFVCEQDFACNGPVEFLDGIKKAGFDVLTNANNHNLDTGVVGIGETIDNIERFGFIQTGTFKSDKKRFEMIEVNGIKIAIAAFETDQNGKAVNVTDEGAAFLLQDYTYKNAKNVYDAAIKDGADLVFACPHWGKENSSKIADDQMEKAEELVEIGYDCIVASHTHVIQPFKYVEKNGRKVPVFFSLGNFISHNVDNIKSRSFIACIDVEVKGNKKQINCSYLPIFTTEYYNDKKFAVVPLSKKTTSTRNKRRLKRIENEIGDQISICDSVKYKGFVEKRPLSVPKTVKDKLAEVKITSYPTIVDMDRFVFEVHEDRVIILKISDGREQISYTTDVDFMDRPVTGLAEGAFKEHKFLKKIKFMNNITTVPKEVCKGCKDLEGIRFGNYTKIVDEEAFADCTKLPCVVLKKRMKEIRSKAFANCTNLRSVKVPNEIKNIADDAFENCPKAIFYCEEGSYAEKWANEHGFEVRNMKIFYGNRK